MDYLYRHPEYVEEWINKESRFDNLARLKEELPQTDLRRTFYNTINDLFHANLRPIDAFGTLHIGEEGNRYLIVGPNPYPIEGSNPIDFASTFISYPIRILWHSHASIMDSEWVARLHKFDAEANFPYADGDVCYEGT